MSIISKGYTLPINSKFIHIIEKELSNAQQTDSNTTTILNFRDPDYSSDHGGYHPVEIMLNEHGIIQYITDFSYVGPSDMAELAKELDFDFANGHMEVFGRTYPLANGAEIFKTFVQNFSNYYQQGIFSVEISQY